MKPIQDDTAWYKAAMELRATISELFSAQPPEKVILAPGILIGLQILFANLGIRRVALTTQEYYSQEHFPALTVETFSIEDLVRQIEDTKPDVVLTSVVTWRGRYLPLNKLFRDIRRTLGDKAPILIADYSHAGAVGFPPIVDLDADIVCGDPAKWVLPQEWISRLAFFWFRNGILFEVAKRAFKPFFLATPEKGSQFFARWLDPQDIQTMIASLKGEGLNRDILLQRHRDNLSLASEIAAEVKPENVSENSIIWLDKKVKSEILPSWLVEAGLVWNPPTGGTRILCRAEAKGDR